MTFSFELLHHVRREDDDVSRFPRSDPSGRLHSTHRVDYNPAPSPLLVWSDEIGQDLSRRHR
ncbi:MAG: hypothetical protein QOF41_310 [Methylobacteriaceae bacterium]|nr:hypothetical protein [Methylobacteriaceae bacterium]